MSHSGRLLAALLATVAIAAADTSTPQALFDEGGRQYALGNHLQAAQQYEQLIASHGVSAPVLFNLGTAQLKAGKLGAASASLVSAARLDPRDKGIARNFGQARLRARGTDSTSSKVARLLAFLSPDRWTTLACGAWWISCALGGVMLLRVESRNRLKGALLCCLAATGILSGAAAVTVLERSGPPLAFVSSANTAVRRAPLREAEGEFSLNDGAQVRVLDSLGEWRLVRLGDGREGWVSAANLAVPIVP